MKIYKAAPIPELHHHDLHLGFIERFLIKPEQNSSGFNRRMFDEDFARLFHSSKHLNGSQFEIVSNDDELMKKLLGNVKTRYTKYSVDETIRELVEEIAQTLIWVGKAYFFLHDDFEHDKLHIVSLSSLGVMRLFRTYIQWVPKRSERYWDRVDEERPREIRLLDTDKIMRFDMPKSIKCMLSVQNKTLAVLDKHRHIYGEPLSLPNATYENPNPANYFDFRHWNDIQDRTLYRATLRTGWNGRKFDSLKRSDFFDCHRLIRFRRNKLKLRDNILNQISSELSRVGNSYKTDFSVEILATDKLPSIMRLNELEEKLKREEVGFNEIVDYCYEC